jgi:L-ascorbate 6-phosphate lactonase
MLQGEHLIADVDQHQPSRGRVAVWWLGQHGFIFKAGGAVVYCDAFLSPMEGRTIEPLVDMNRVGHATVIIGSHDHADHIDRGAWPSMAKAAAAARFVVPDLVRELVSKDLQVPLDRLIGMDEGQSVELPGVKITAIASAHEFLDRDPATGRHPFLGFIIEMNGRTIYHAGDTVAYEGLQTKLKKWKLDAAFVPINGRDAERYAAGIIGNMTFPEAADLVCPLRPGLVVPTHWDMFAGNPGDPEAFARYVAVKYPGVRTHIPEYGARFEV